MSDGRFLLLFHNNDGTANGGRGPEDWRVNRRPAFISVGEYRANAHQPIWFSRPKLFVDNDGIPIDPSQRTEIATYTSFTEKGGSCILWYPDRKFFLLGKYVTED